MYRDALDSIVTPAYSVKVENIEKSGLIWLTYRVEYPVTTATEITLKKISKRVDTNKTRKGPWVVDSPNAPRKIMVTSGIHVFNDSLMCGLR